MDQDLDILLIEDNPGDVALLEESLPGEIRIRLGKAIRLADGVALARERHFDVMLLDLTLPDTAGVDTIRRAATALPEMPIVVLTGVEDEESSSQAVRDGAQDYLVKGKVDRWVILRSIRYAIERKRAAVELQKANDLLEEKVRHRTGELAATVETLQAEVRQRQASERIVKMVSECNQALVRIQDELALTKAICRTILEVGGYRMAWVGYAMDDPGKTVRPVARVGFEEGYLERAAITWADTERGRGPTGSAIRLGQPRIGHDFLNDPELAPWREEAIRRGFQSSIALPLAFGGRVFGALTIYAAQPRAFDDSQAQVLTDLADDLAYGIMTLRTRGELRQSQEHLRQVVHDAPVVIWAVDLKGTITLADGQLESLGLESRPLVGRPIGDLIGRRGDIQDHVRRAGEGEQVAAEVEFCERLFDSRYSPLRDASGRTTGVLCVSTDITQRRRAEREVIEATEREQNRIGRDLHDSIQGSLAGISLMLACLKRRPDSAAAGLVQEIDKIESLINQTLHQTRDLARSLCPVDLGGDGLMRAMEILASTTSSLFRVPCEFQCKRSVLLADKTVALHLYYIAHEAVNNALKHARAKRIRLALEQQGTGLLLAVQDNGVGIPPARTGGGMGLRTMAYRAAAIGANLSIGPAEGGGTAVRCLLPPKAQWVSDGE